MKDAIIENTIDNDLLTRIITRIQMIKERGYEPKAVILHPQHRLNILTSYYPHTDWEAVKPRYMKNPIIYGLIVYFDHTLTMDEILVAYDPLPM